MDELAKTKDVQSESAQDANSMPTMDYAALLPYEVFDDTEFEQRTIDEWLDLRTQEDIDNNQENDRLCAWINPAASNDIKYAKIPIPAKAFHRNIWRNCFVTAYNQKTQLWKAVWSTESGWDLEKPVDDGLEDDEEEDIFAATRDEIIVQGVDPGFMWLHR